MIPAVIYAAKSTKDPHLSIPTQLQDAEAAARAAGREPQGPPYSDEAASAYKGNRGQGLTDAKDHALALAAEHGTAELWVQHSDRLARGDGLTADHLAEVWFALRRHGVALRSAQDDHNLEDALRVVLVGERNHEDSKRKAQAVASGHGRRRAKGGYHGGPEAYALAYPRDERGRTIPELPLAIVEERAVVVRRMVQMILEGASMHQVAKALNTDGVPTATGSKRWAPGTVRRIVRNPIYAARAKDGSPLAHPAIIDPETFDRVQAVLASRARVGSDKGGRKTNGAALFVNQHLRCGQCGSTMGYRSKPTRTGGLWERYSCTRHEKDPEACPQMPVPVADIHERALYEFAKRGLSGSQMLADQQASAQADLAHAEALLASAEREVSKAAAAMARVKADYKAGELTAAEWRELREEIEGEQAAAQLQATMLADRVAATRLRASSQVQDAFTEAMTLLGHAADKALRGELPLEGVRDPLRALFPIVTWRQDGRQGYLDLGESQAETVALYLDDELPGRAGEPLLRRDSTTGALGLTSAPVIAPIPVELEA